MRKTNLTTCDIMFKMLSGGWKLDCPLQVHFYITEGRYTLMLGLVRRKLARGNLSTLGTKTRFFAKSATASNSWGLGRSSSGMCSGKLGNKGSSKYLPGCSTKTVSCATIVFNPTDVKIVTSISCACVIWKDLNTCFGVAILLSRFGMSSHFGMAT